MSAATKSPLWAGSAEGAQDLREFLSSSKAAFVEHSSRAAAADGDAGGRQVQVVMGNESCDLDSIVSAIVYARMLGAPFPKAGGGDEPAGTEAAPPPVCVVPLLNIPKADLNLRRDVVFVFEQLELNPDDLLFIDDPAVDLHALQAAGRLSLALVDHNVLAGRHSELGSSVTSILDHHVDEKKYPHVAVQEIRPVGSCTALVAEKALGPDNVPPAISKAEGHMLLATILIDTINLDKASGRGTDTDFSMAAKLAALAGVADPDALYQELFKAKQDVATLNANELLRKDYKEYRIAGLKLGIASVPVPLATLLAKEDAQECHAAFCSQNAIDILLVMTAFLDAETGAFTREIAAHVVQEHAAQLEGVQSLLLGGGLGLETLALQNLWPKAIAYAQKELRMSRKKIAPLMKTFVPV